MPGPWLLLTLALTLTLTGSPGGRAQPQAAQQEAEMAAEHPALDDLLRQAEGFLLLQDDIQRLRGDLGQPSESLQPDSLSKRQHPGKREEEAEEGVEEEEEEGGAVGPHKRQHPGRREDEAAWSLDRTQQRKRQHPGRRSPWLGPADTKRQHPGRRLVDAQVQGSWREEQEEDAGEGTPRVERRQHPGKRALGGPCAPQGACAPSGLLLGLLSDLSRGQGTQEKPPHPERRASWTREPLEE
ncbi:thyrotropin releasing hormone [Ictidomys tridecemlineatus]|uniref:Pro-thyrotropin-releasing hormone n=1 Tax=Ictidomys tridecemlineatus TaxID=43179 RepID=I3NCI2_ICTTR|nr:thyrotropin releasing hormone [Ictidomys tridecemlineatus]XP_040147034.1 thyrotropin releasing hormone [Ictidomys tridecemlineatus]KAG3295153.1 thyrotropin releasing hormone [Ictidomys tridecemlineatus]